MEQNNNKQLSMQGTTYNFHVLASCYFGPFCEHIWLTSLWLMFYCFHVPSPPEKCIINMSFPALFPINTRSLLRNIPVVVVWCVQHAVGCTFFACLCHHHNSKDKTCRCLPRLLCCLLCQPAVVMVTHNHMQLYAHTSAYCTHVHTIRLTQHTHNYIYM